MITPGKRKIIMADARAGLPYDDIAKKVGISPSGVSAIARSNGLRRHRQKSTVVSATLIQQLTVVKRFLKRYLDADKINGEAKRLALLDLGIRL